MWSLFKDQVNKYDHDNGWSFYKDSTYALENERVDGSLIPQNFSWIGWIEGLPRHPFGTPTFTCEQKIVKNIVEVPVWKEVSWSQTSSLFVSWIGPIFDPVFA